MSRDVRCVGTRVGAAILQQEERPVFYWPIET